MTAKTPEVCKLVEKFRQSHNQLLEVSRRFLNEINRGLRKSTHDQADVKCFVTYVQDIPTGKETGKYLALDLGGTNFRVLLISLNPHSEVDIRSKIYAIPKDVMVGAGVQLFDHIAECLAVFVKENELQTECLRLGFTFSFPLKQINLTKGILVRWTKGFKCTGVENEDVVQLLNNAILKRGDINVSVAAVLNDTTGTLMSCAHRNKNCKVGVIIGTGCNACYMERIENAELFNEHSEKSHVIINTELGAFGENGTLDFIRTVYDREVDQASLNPGKQVFEKLVSGMYMGEIVRLILLKAIDQNILFRNTEKTPQKLKIVQSFQTSFLSEIEADGEGIYTNCRKILTKFGILKATDEDCAAVRYICETVSKRSANLIASILATLLNKVGEPIVTIGVDGSVYRLHPKFSQYMREKMLQLVDPAIQFDLMLSYDGSGRGAALVAAMANNNYCNSIKVKQSL